MAYLGLPAGILQSRDYTSRVLFVPDREHVEDCRACVTCRRPDAHLASSVCMRTTPPMLCDDCQLWVSLIQFAFFPSPFMPISWPPIKNAPRWLVKGRWEWRLGLFKDLSQLFRAKFDSENGGGLISHAEVFRGGSGTERNARRSDESSTGINQKWNVCCQLGLTSFDSGSQRSYIYTTTPLKTDGGWMYEVGNSARRSFVSVPF